MTAVRRPDPHKSLLELTRRLAEQFATLPIPTVTGAVRAAASATALFGDDAASSIDTIERIAREDLGAVRDAASEAAQITLAS